MFYAKVEMLGASLNVDLTHENIFNACPGCGKETPVDLSKIGEYDFHTTAVYCDDCSQTRKRP